MYACSFSWRSSAPATIGTPGWSASMRATPSGAATTHTNVRPSGCAACTYVAAAEPDPPVASIGSSNSACRPPSGGSFA